MPFPSSTYVLNHFQDVLDVHETKEEQKRVSPTGGTI